MTQRERSPSGGVSDAPVKDVRPQEPRPSVGGTPPVGGFPLWEDLFLNASGSQRKELLALAERQGVVYAHQFPAPVCASPVPPEASRTVLTRLLRGQLDDLDPLRLRPAPAGETALDDAQCLAMSCALETPDICVIQGRPGTGKSFLVAEIISRAAARGERILLLGAGAAAIDRTLELVANRDMVCAIRCVAPDEEAALMAPAVRALTFAERARSFREHSLECARREVARAEERLVRRQTEELVWKRLEDLVTHHNGVQKQLEDLARVRTQLSGAIEAEAQAAEQGTTAESRVATSLRDALRARDQARLGALDAIKEARQTIDSRRQELETLEGQRSALRPLIEAKQQKRWWTGSWWWATIQGNVIDKARELDERSQAVQKAVSELEATAHRLTNDLDLAEATFRAERARLVDAEVARRQSEFDDQESALTLEKRRIQEKWLAACQEVDSESPRPLELTSPAVSKAREEWHSQARGEEERLAFARQWADCLREAAETLPSRLLAYVNLVAATPASLPGDPHFGDQARNVHFDLLICDQAHNLTESEFLAAARRARRSVLVGEPTLNEDSPNGVARGPRRPPARTSNKPAALRPGFFQRLWENLHADPGSLRYEWFQENGRLCCRLRPLTEEQYRRLEREPVADRPEIELRIAEGPGGEPLLAEIAFPSGIDPSEARGYVFRELNELPLDPPGHSLRWNEDEKCLTLRLSEEPLSHPQGIPLEDGVREIVGRWSPGRGPWRLRTCCLEFDRGAGWTQSRAEAWTLKHLGLRDTGRTVRLTTPHRCVPPLAMFLSDVLFEGEAAPRSLPEARDRPPVEFIAVPPLPPGRGTGNARGRGEDRRARREPPRSGAGLEQELADNRHGDRLPGDVRAALPSRGLVNYMEALAVVRALEGMSAALPEGAPLLPIAVIAMTGAQVELLRLLTGRSTILGTGKLPLIIDVPIGFLEKEFGTVVVSLTRSHTHRAVTYGENPQMLALALTRARERLLIFGDVGTMVRRAQWEATVDHLDEAASEQERRFVGGLVDYLLGHGRYPGVIHLREGGSA